MQRRRALDLVVLALALALIAILGSLRAANTAGRHSEPSTHDTGASGYAALYDLLAREGVRVGRFEFPISELPVSRSTLVLAGNGALDAAVPSPGATKFLNAWVRRGGRLVVLDAAISRAVRRALGLPRAQPMPSSAVSLTACGFPRQLRGAAVAGTYASGYAPACRADRATLLAAHSRAIGMLYRRGPGLIAIFSTATPFDNLHLAQHANARIAYALFAGGPVIFDERVHGYAAGRSFWEVLPQAMRIAIAIAIAAALLAIAGANLPFAPPLDIRTAEERDSGAYIASLARMLERGGAAHEAIARISARCEQILGSRASSDERARMLLRELRTLAATPRPGPHQVLAAGRIFARMRKDYGC